MTQTNLIFESIRRMLCSNQGIIKLVLPLIIVNESLLPFPFLAEEVHLVDGILLLALLDFLIFAAIFDGPIEFLK